MTKKDCIRLSKIFQEHQDRASIILAVITMLQQDNPKFKRDEFIEACRSWR